MADDPPHAPIRDLATLLRDADPVLRPGDWVFVTVDEVPDGVEPLATFREDAGLSLLVERSTADAHGLAYELVCAWITLRVTSALDAVGLTAAAAAALAAIDVPCNVVAARHHDHLLVPADRAEEAVAALARLDPAGTGTERRSTPARTEDASPTTAGRRP